MTDDRIGSFVQRIRGDDPNQPLTWLHLVESTISDEPVTKCGRRLRDKRGSSFLYMPSAVGRVCSDCAP